jgi:hypothetical protein
MLTILDLWLMWLPVTKPEPVVEPEPEPYLPPASVWRSTKRTLPRVHGGSGFAI